MFYSAEQVEALCQNAVKEFIKLIAQAHFSDEQAARLIGVSRVTVHNWRRRPPPRMDTASFLNVLAANKWMQAGIDGKHLPCVDRHAARYYLDRLQRGIKTWPEKPPKRNAPLRGGEEEETANHA